MKILRGVASPLRGREPGDFEFVVVRENTEGEYSSAGGRVHTGFPHELVIQNTVFTRLGTERVIRYAFGLAAKSPRRRLTSATKSNGINWSMPFWDEIFTDLGAAIMGGIGLAPSANINPERKYPSMFEPVHGSAPDIAGKGIANPIEDVLEEGRVWTPDLGGTSTTTEVTDAIVARLRALAK